MRKMLKKVLVCLLCMALFLSPMSVNAVSDAEKDGNWSVGIKATANGTASATITITMGSYFSQPIVITSFSWTNGSLPIGTRSSYSATFTVTKNATYTVTAKDSSGHAKTASVVVSNIEAADITKPTIGTPSVTLNSAKTAATVTVSISDSGSGVATKKWASGSQIASYFASNGTSFSNSFTVTANGTYTIYAKDNAGNENVRTFTVSGITAASDTGYDTTLIPGKEYYIRNVGNEKRLDSEMQATSGAWVYARTAANSLDQRWFFRNTGTPYGIQSIGSRGLSLYFDYVYIGGHYYYQPTLYPYQNNSKFKWYPSKTTGQTDRFRIYTGQIHEIDTAYRYIDPKAHNTSDSTIGLTYVAAGDLYQQWTFEPVYSLGNKVTNLSGSYYVSPTNPLDSGYGRQCVVYVWGRVYEKYGYSLAFSVDSGRNARYWMKIVTGIISGSMEDVTELNSGSTVRSNSIAVFDATSSNGYGGHVQFVEYVENGYVYYTEGNYDITGSDPNDGNLKRKTLSAFTSQSAPYLGCIYLD